jgi:hypothetical protein
MSSVRLALTRELRPTDGSHDPLRGFLGSDKSGAVFVGCSDTGCDASDPRVWLLGHYVPDDRRVWAKTNAVAALTRRAADLWVLGRPGLFRVHAGLVQSVTDVRCVDAPSEMGVATGWPAPVLIASEEIQGSALAVDPAGMAWTLGPGGLRVFLPPSGERTATQRSWYMAGFVPRNWGCPALAADPSGGVWLYTPPMRDPEQSLLHLVVEGIPPDAKIAVAEDSPRFADLPALAYPHMAVAADGRIAIVGQTLAGDRLAEVVNGRLTSQLIPHELLSGRHVTALDTDTRGTLYLATDGAGVLTYKHGQWSVHPITEHLPTMAASDLKPVDDVLAGDDNTVYAACQYQVVIWKPDEAQP